MNVPACPFIVKFHSALCSFAKNGRRDLCKLTKVRIFVKFCLTGFGGGAILDADRTRPMRRERRLCFPPVTMRVVFPRDALCQVNYAVLCEIQYATARRHERTHRRACGDERGAREYASRGVVRQQAKGTTKENGEARTFGKSAFTARLVNI